MNKNKSKEQIKRELALLEKQKARVAKEKYIAKTVFPLVENLKTVYDAQTALNAASGYVQSALAERESLVKVHELHITLSKEDEKSDVGQAVKSIIDSMVDVDAKSVGDLLERMGQKLAEYVANKHMKDPMTIKASEFIAE